MTTKNLGSATVSGGIARTQYTIPSDELVGDFTLNGTYVENNHYKEATATADFKVRIATTITVSDVIANHGESATFTANVKYNNTLNVNEGQVQFKIGGTIIGTGNVSQGVATCSYTIPQSVEDGTEITATFLGTSTYGTSVTSNSGTLNIRGKTTVQVEARLQNNVMQSFNRGISINIRAYAYDEDTSQITNGTMEFYLDNVKIGESEYYSTSHSYGMSYTIPNDITAGAHTLKAVFLQTSSNERGEGTSNITIRMPTHIVANAVSANAGSNINLVANIYDENNNIVTEGQATFTDPNNQTSNVSVGSSGVATKTVSIPANAEEGSTIQYTVFYVLNSNYESSTSATITITIRKTPVLVVNDVTANRGDIVYLTASVEDNVTGDDVNEGSITFTLTQT